MRQLLARVATRAGALPLFWRVVLTNGVVFVLGTAALAISPATVSSPVVLTEAVVLAVGLGVILVANGLLLRRSLRPLDQLGGLMGRVDLLRPGVRLPTTANGAVGNLIGTFNDMLDRLEAERGTSAARALAAQEGERHRIAQELHDEVGQGLTVVLLGLKRVSAAAPPAVRADLLLVQEAARSTLDDVRAVANRLRPGVLEDLGLVSALSALANDFTEVTGIPVRRVFDRDLPDLSREVDLVIYRIAQEGLTNVARHAAAEHVELRLGRAENGVTLGVDDDGRGLGRDQEGAGIRGMRERAILVDGRLHVADRPGGGTALRLVVPVGAAVAAR